MSIRLLIIAALVAGNLGTGATLAQTAIQRGQSRAKNRLPQASSGGVPTGSPASGPQTAAQKQADTTAKRATKICKGC